MKPIQRHLYICLLFGCRPVTKELVEAFRKKSEAATARTLATKAADLFDSSSISRLLQISSIAMDSKGNIWIFSVLESPPH